MLHRPFAWRSLRKSNRGPDSCEVQQRTERAISGVIEVVEAAIHEAATDHKIIAFFPTAQMTAFYAKLFNAAGSRSAFEIHSRKSQAQRTRCSDQFRAAAEVA